MIKDHVVTTVDAVVMQSERILKAKYVHNNRCTVLSNVCIMHYDCVHFHITSTVVPQLTEPHYLNSSEATFYYKYHYNLQDGRSLVALWQL